MKVIGVVLVAHYLAAFTALGMPLFMPRVLASLAPEAGPWLSGALYVLPTVCTALTASAWGRMADRLGRKLSLLRAQLGLALGFALAGFAPNLGWFVFALVLQGSCGGSLAAANAYLSTRSQGASLARCLDWTQSSARLAMLTAPVLLGLATTHGMAQELYRYLAVLPLLAFALTYRLPSDRRASGAASPPSDNSASAAGTEHRLGRLPGVQFLFYFAMVVTFPYFIPYCERLGVSGDSVAGLLYSLPHLVYLLVLPWLRAQHAVAGRRLLAGLALFCAACLIQACISQAPWLWPARLLYGLGMLLAISGINRALSLHAGPASGRLFGRFDAYGKWAGAAAGVVAGILVQQLGVNAPFFAAALASATAFALQLIPSPSIKPRPSYVATSDS